MVYDYTICKVHNEATEEAAKITRFLGSMQRLDGNHSH